MIWETLRISLLVAAAATLASVAVGLPLAWTLARKWFRGRQLASALVLVPMLLPPTVLGYYLLQAVGRRSWLGEGLDAAFEFSPVFHWTGAALAAFVVSVPFLIRSAQAGFESIDRSYEEAARTSGVHGVRLFVGVALPLAWPSVAAGIAMAFARAVGEFGATLMVAGSIPGRTRTMPIAIYEAVQAGRTTDAQVLALVLTVLAVGIIAAIGTFAKGRRW